MKVLQLMTFTDDEYQYYIKRGRIDSFHNPQYMGYDKLCKMCEIDWYNPQVNNWFSRLVDKFAGAKIASFILGQFKLVKIANKYDLIYFPLDAHITILAILRFLKICKTPILMMSNTSFTSIDAPYGKIRFFKKIEWKLLLRTIDKIFFLSPDLMKRAVENNKIPLKFQSCVKWGANNEFYKTDIKKGSASYYVAIGQAKRDFYTLVRAFQQMPNLKLLILARGNDVLKKIELESLPPNIEIIDNENDGQHWTRMKEIYKNAKASLIPLNRSSDIPSGGTVICESIASATPIIITKFDNMLLDIEGNGIGLYVEPHNVKDWIDKITSIENNPELINEMSNKEKKLSKEYNYDKFSIDIYNKLLELNKKTYKLRSI